MISKFFLFLIGSMAAAMAAAPKQAPLNLPDESGAFVVIAFQLRGSDLVPTAQVLDRLRKPKKGDIFEASASRELRADSPIQFDGRRYLRTPKQVATETRHGGKPQVVGTSGETSPVGICYRAQVVDPGSRSIEVAYEATLLLGMDRVGKIEYPVLSTIGVRGIGVATPVQFGDQDFVVMPFPTIGEDLAHAGLVFFWKK